MAFAVDLPIHRERPGPLVLDWQIQNKLGATNNLINSAAVDKSHYTDLKINLKGMAPVLNRSKPTP